MSHQTVKTAKNSYFEDQKITVFQAEYLNLIDKSGIPALARVWRTILLGSGVNFCTWSKIYQNLLFLAKSH